MILVDIIGTTVGLLMYTFVRLLLYIFVGFLIQVDCEDIGKEDQTERRKQPSNTCDENVSQETVELGAAGEVATSLVQDVTTDHIENPWRQRKRKRIPPGTEGDQLKTVDTRKEKVLL